MRERVTRLSSYVILRDGGKVLLCRLSAETTAPGCWTLPGGGLEFGESPEEAATREVFEETGLTVANLCLQTIWTETEVFQDKEFHLLRFIYTGSFQPGPLQWECEGSTDICEWIEESRLAEMPLVSLVKKTLSVAGQS